ncbi:MAG: Mur ligase family protein, partial [Syntrophomonadaceae bacterium]|nr:Mur ligase family protein [Syntrophomonadaceae bacterium]
MQLSELLTGIDFQYQQGSDSVNISMLHYDSRKILPGGLFLCVPGQLTDGHLYIEQAVENGAVAIVAERDVSVPEGVTCIKTTDVRKSMARIAANFYDHPSTQLRVVGITGTNGKTTVSHLIQVILEEYGAKTGILGTLYARIDKWQKEYGHTTPESIEVQEFLDMVRQMSGQWAIMEVSSHALEQFRVDHIDFNVAVFTNLTQDHLDYHGTMH